MISVILDTSPLSILCSPKRAAATLQCRQWVLDLLRAGRDFFIAEIANYEFKREAHRRRQSNSLKYLEQWRSQLKYLPITTPIMDHAAKLWAQVRLAGLPTAGNDALDADVILAATALSLNTSVIVATSNPAHLSRFVAAERWELISP